MNHLQKIISCLPLLVASVSAAEPLPLAQAFWQDESFVKSFNGSYRINAKIEPNVNSEQRALLVSMQKSMSQGKRKQALSMLSGSSLTDQSAALIYNKGNVLFELGRNQEAIKCYQKAIQLYPSFRRAYRNLGLAQMREGLSKEARVSLVEAVQLGDHSGLTFGMLGYCHIQDENVSSALQAYRMAQITQPEESAWSAGVSQCLLQSGQYKEALVMISEVVKKYPDEKSYWLLKAQAHAQLGEDVDAVAVLEWLNEKQSLSSSGRFLLVKLWLRQGNPDLAWKVMESLLQAEEKANYIEVLNILDLVTQQEQWAFAIRCEDALKKFYPDVADTKLKAKVERLSAMILIGRGEDLEVVKLRFEELLIQYPNDGNIMLYLADIYRRQQSYEEATVIFERAARLSDFSYKANLKHGEMLVGQRLFASALKKLRAAYTLEPSTSLDEYILAVERLVD